MSKEFLPSIHRRAVLFARDMMLRQVNQSILSAEESEGFYRAARLELPDSVLVLRHAAGILLSLATGMEIPEAPTPDEDLQAEVDQLRNRAVRAEEEIRRLKGEVPLFPPVEEGAHV